MIFLLLDFDNHVVHINFHRAFDIFLKDSVDKLLVYCHCIKYEGYNLEAVVPGSMRKDVASMSGSYIFIWLYPK